MKIERGHILAAALTLAAIGYVTLYTPAATYLSARQAEAAQTGAQAHSDTPDEGAANVATAGGLAAGTQLTRDGVAVAELWAIREVDARDAAAVDFTSHDSAQRFAEVKQSIRELRRVEVLGHHLPTQTGAWIDDLNAGDVHTYKITWPDASTSTFRGWVQKVAAQSPIAGALTFTAIIYPVYGVPEYYHCILAPDAPGTPPSADPDHWEEATVDDFTVGGVALAAGEAVFGNAGESGPGNQFEVGYVLASLFPAAGGAATATKQFVVTPTSWPTWNATLGEEQADFGVDNLDIWAAYYGATNEVVRASAYLTCSEEEQNWMDVMVGVYSQAGAFMGGSDAVRVYAGASAWVEFGFTTPVAIDPEASYWLALWSRFGPGAAWVHVGVGGYSPPAGSEWDPDWGTVPGTGYVFCNYVRYLPD